MSVPEAAAGAEGTTSDDYSEEYYATYAGHGDYDWGNEGWRTFFTQVASRVKAITNAHSVLDVGCAKGLLVQALVERGVDARGLDVSRHAIESAHPDVRDRLAVGSATDPIPGRYDLISFIEVAEHLSPREAETALDRICAATDQLLFTSTPGHFDDPSHINVRPTAEWVAGFADRGFFRRTDVNLDFLAPWAVLLQRADLSARDVVRRYEPAVATLHTEVLEKRSALLEAHRDISRLSTDASDTPSARERLLALQGRLDEQRQHADELEQTLLTEGHDRLTVRDHVIGLEARADELTRKLTSHQSKLTTEQEQVADLQGRLRRQLHRAEAAEQQLEEAHASRSWRWGRALSLPLRALRR